MRPTMALEHTAEFDLESVITAAHVQQAIAVVAADLVGLALLNPPGEMGADVAVGSSQRFVVPMGFGGPHAAYFATRDRYKRVTPGIIIGVSTPWEIEFVRAEDRCHW